MNSGTKSLLEGERKAHQIVETAKERKNDMNKNAKWEAQQELGEIRQLLDEQYNEFKQETEAKIDNLKSYESEAQSEIQEINDQYEQNKE